MPTLCGASYTLLDTVGSYFYNTYTIVSLVDPDSRSDASQLVISSVLIGNRDLQTLPNIN